MATTLHPKTKDGMWAVIRELKTFSRTDICDRTLCEKRNVTVFVQSLEKAGYIQAFDMVPVNRLNKDKIIYRLVRDSLTRPVLTKDGKQVAASDRQRMWKALYVIGKSAFDHRDLSLVSVVSAYAAREYIRFLHRAGYLREVRKALPGVKGMFVLIQSRYTGPLAPEVRKNKSEVFDLNLGKVTWQKEASDVQS